MSTIFELPRQVVKPAFIRVAAYARVSTESDKQLHSYSAQVSHYQELIRSRPGWQFAGIYTDHGISGTSTLKRDGFNNMMDAARTGEIDLILTKSISRFARNTVDLLAYVRELKALGVTVQFERENIDTSTMDGEILLTLLASFAQAESETNSDAVKWAVRKKYQEGYGHSYYVLGYQTVGRELLVVPDEADIVRRLYSSYLEGISPETVCRQLKAEGKLPTSRGMKVNEKHVRPILENPIYTGMIIGQKYFVPTVGGTAKLNEGEHPQYVVEGHHEPIIEQELFDAVQAEIKRRRKAGHLTLAPSLGTTALTHRVVCSKCGRCYHRRTKCRKNMSYKYWWCELATRGKGNPCKAHQIREVLLHKKILNTLELEKWDDAALLEVIDHIVITPEGQIQIHLKNGNVKHAEFGGAQ
ncbi:recombinase family protein [Trueperella pyogenes]|uniref:recombinase family protein n=1 Tax=Trueperella pyogenes TaxID=1661 RepID=UPI003248222C